MFFYFAILFVYVFCLVFLIRKRWYLSSAFLISYFLYKASAFVSFYYFENPFGFKQEEIQWIVWCSLTVSASFVLGAFLFSRIRTTQMRENVRMLFARETMVFLALCLFVYYAYFVYTYGSFIVNLGFQRSDLFSVRQGTGVFSIFLYAISLGYVKYMIEYITRHQSPPLLSFFTISVVVLMVLNMRLGERGEILVLLLPVIAALHYYRIIKGYQVAFFLALFIAVFLFVGVFRSVWNVSEALGSIRENFGYLFFNSEFIANNLVDREVFSGPGFVENPLEGYYNSILSLVPQFIWPERPLAMVEEFTKVNFPHLYSQNASIAFSLNAEILINLGSLGLVLVPVSLGMLMGYADMKSRRSSDSFYLAVYFVSLFFVFILPRTGITGILKPYVFGVILPYTIFRFFYRLCRQR